MNDDEFRVKRSTMAVDLDQLVRAGNDEREAALRDDGWMAHYDVGELCYWSQREITGAGSILLPGVAMTYADGLLVEKLRKKWR